MKRTPRLPDFVRLLGELPAKSAQRDRVPAETEFEPAAPEPAHPSERVLRRRDPLLRRLLRHFRARGGS